MYEKRPNYVERQSAGEKESFLCKARTFWRGIARKREIAREHAHAHARETKIEREKERERAGERER